MPPNCGMSCVGTMPSNCDMPTNCAMPPNRGMPTLVLRYDNGESIQPPPRTTSPP
ncbi:hypothetical protein RAS2_32610 [Phycisphaerae bacterium RAS2]|nr:hypothetical protein RAS2_32610 [Phycisphaerae bacterium RAS2]